MFIYQPTIYSNDRVVWYGGQSTQLHYEKEQVDDNSCPKWTSIDVRIFGLGIPAGVSELHTELVDYYNYCQVTEYI